MLGSAKTSAVIMIIIACSGPFGWALANWKIPEAISSAVLSVSTNKYVILFLISLIILVAGVFMETSSAIIILTPVFLPLVRALGISTLHFGILFVVGIAIGMITPPVAINLFVASGITGLSLEKISKAVVPYLIGLIVVFLAIVYLPLFIPRLHRLIFSGLSYSFQLVDISKLDLNSKSSNSAILSFGGYSPLRGE